jgi:hypothetical protein
MRNHKTFIKQIHTFLLLVSFLSGIFPIFAQTKRGATKSGNSQVATNQPKQTAQKCSGAWTGTITYTRTQTTNNSKTVPRVSGRGEDTTTSEIKYKYKAAVTVVEAPEKNGSSIGKAHINHLLTLFEVVEAKEKNSCDRGKTWQIMAGTITTNTETKGIADNQEANVHIAVNTDGTYTVSVALPRIQGESTGTQISSYSGQCKPKEGKTFTMPTTQTSIDGNSLTTDGSHKINTSAPNHLEGGYTKNWQNITETIQWSLQKCGSPRVS